MLENSTGQFRKFLEDLLDEIDVPISRYEQAVQRFHSVADWFKRDQSRVARFAPDLYSQGSFRLGTVIKPPVDEDYDIDLVCQINLSKSKTTQKQLKKLIGDEIAAYAVSQRMNEPPKEGSRCWTLNYADGAQFHLDILPCVPDSQRFRQLLVEARVEANWTENAIAITDKGHPNYSVIANDWLQSNPRGYGEWFKSRMATELQAQKRLLAEKIHARVEEVPTWRVKTPLQRVVQLLKKHRDEMFVLNPEDKPISIIITTLTARLYENERDLIQVLGKTAQHIAALVEKRNGVWWVPNPVNPLENFADRWQQFPQRAEAFFSWTRKLQEDLAAASELTDVEDIGGTLYESYGNTTVANVLRKRRGLIAASASRSLVDVSHKQAPPWKIVISGKAAITARMQRGINGIEIFSDGPAVPKGKWVRFKVRTNVQPPYDLRWQVVNTGDEAKKSNDMRGDFYDSDSEPGRWTRKETTKYTGRHWVECFVIKGGVCVARTDPFYVNIQ